MNNIDILGKIKEFKVNGIHNLSFSGTILTHPNNKKYIDEINKILDNGSPIHISRPYEVKYNQYLDELGWVIEYIDTPLWKYSDGPSSDMTIAEYEKMCLYFGWARKVRGGPAFYFIDEKPLESFKEIKNTIGWMTKKTEDFYCGKFIDLQKQPPFFASPIMNDRRIFKVSTTA